MFLGRPEDLPEPLRAAFQEHERAHDRLEMEADDARHDFFRVIHTFDAEQVSELRQIFAFIASSEQDAVMHAAWYQGWLTREEEARFGICPACHKNHDEELGKLSTPPAAPEPTDGPA